MEDIAPALLELLRKRFSELVAVNPKIRALYKRIQEGNATYADAEEYAWLVGNALSQAFGENLSSAVLPDGRMYYNIADRVLRPILEEDHGLIADAAVLVQTALNEKAGIGIKAQTVEVNTDRIQGILDKVHAVAYGIPEDGRAAKPQTGTFWDEIKHFTRDEAFIGCPCGKCGGFPAEPTERLMRAADAVREHFGVPMIPTSTVRCADRNLFVGGAKNSRHMEGRAMDFYVKGRGSAEVLAFVRTLNPSYAYAIDGGAVHMDF